MNEHKQRAGRFALVSYVFSLLMKLWFIFCELYIIKLSTTS